MTCIILLVGVGVGLFSGVVGFGSRTQLLGAAPLLAMQRLCPI